VTFLKDTPYKGGLYGSKASGEPPLILAMGVNFAIQSAAKAAREDAGDDDQDRSAQISPLTYEKSQSLCKVFKFTEVR